MSVTPDGTTRDDRVQAYLRAALNISGTNVIPAERNDPAPNNLYATYLLLNDTPRGIDNVQTRIVDGDDTKSNFNVRGVRAVNYSVQAYRTGAEDAIRRLRLYHITPAGQLLLEQQDLVFRRVSEVRELTEVISDGWEPRYSVDIEFWVYERFTEEINNLASAEIHFGITADGNDITSTTEVN